MKSLVLVLRILFNKIIGKKIMNQKLILMIIAIIFSYNIIKSEWVEISDFPVQTDGSFSFVIDDIAYVNGGLANNYLYAYNIKDDTWERKSDVPSKGTHLAWAFSFSIDGKGYIIGGSYQTASDLTDEVWEYNPDDNSWTQKNDFPFGPIDGGFSFSIGKYGYVGCGFDGQYLKNDFYKYEPSTDKWETLPQFPGGPVIFPASFVINNIAYAGTGDQAETEIRDFWSYNPNENKWSRQADFPGLPRQTAIGYSLENMGYIGGGMSSYSINRQDFWQYNPENDEWKQLENANLNYFNTAWSVGFTIENYFFYGTGVNFPDFLYSNKFYKRNFSQLINNLEDDNNHFEMFIYPNPFKDILYINNKITHGNKLVIFDLLGNEVYRKENVSSYVNLSHLKKGIYFVQLFNNENVKIEKILKQ